MLPSSQSTMTSLNDLNINRENYNNNEYRNILSYPSQARVIKSQEEPKEYFNILPQEIMDKIRHLQKDNSIMMLSAIIFLETLIILLLIRKL